MMDLKEIFDSDDVELFEQSCKLTQNERLKLVEFVQRHINSCEEGIANDSTNRTDEKNLPLSDCKIPKYPLHIEQAGLKILKCVLEKLFRELTNINTDVDMRALSEKLSTLADNMGFTEEARAITIEHFKVETVLLNLKHALCGETVGLRIVGSKAEGTANLNRDTDVDVLNFNHLIPVYLASQNKQTNRTHLRMVEDKITPAGYMKLQLFDNGHAVNENNVIWYESLFHHKLIVDNTKVFLGNEFTENTSFFFKHYELEKHGPATTFEGDKKNISVDCVPAFICKSLPDDVIMWFNRKRRYGWPNDDTMKLFKQMGCVVVPVGHTDSPEQNLQWRLSFTNQEMYLMHNLNMTQYKCYVILKQFKATFMKQIASGVVSAYHLKTVLFYTKENSSPSIWQPKYLAYVILKCLHTLRQWVSEMNCPNYFIPLENMFSTKFNQEIKEELNFHLSFQFDKQYVLRLLLHMYEYEIPCKMDLLLYFSRLRRESLEEIDFNFGNTFRKNGYPKTLIIINIIQCLKIFTGDNECALCPTLRGYTVFPELLIVALFMRNAGTYGPHVQPYLYEMPIFKDIYPILIDSSAVRSAFGHVQRFLHAKIASYALLSCHQITWQKRDMLFDFVNHHVQKAAKAHAVNIRLKQISSLYVAAHHELVDVILEKAIVKKLYVYELLIHCFHSFVCKEGTVFGNTRTFLMKEVKTDLRKLKSHQLNINYLTDITTTCLTFDSIETPMVPGLLQYEIHKTVRAPIHLDMSIYSSLITVDPIIYLYYLWYKNKEKMDDTSGISYMLCRLEIIVLDNLRDAKLWHLDTALNCLGHIYVTKGWQRLAISCFESH